jgi:hypothetical protein
VVTRVRYLSRVFMGEPVSYLRSFGLSTSLLLVAACTAGGPTALPSTPQASVSPSSLPAVQPSATVTPAPTTAPTSGPTSEPSANLDPTLSDAGIVARVTLTNDTFGERDGTYDVIGVAADASFCPYTAGDVDFTAVAYHDDAPNGQIHQFSVTVPTAEVPRADGVTSDIDGRVSFDFVSESGFGTLYIGDASDGDGHATVSVTRAATTLIFDFAGATKGDAQFAGQLICANA